MYFIFICMITHVYIGIESLVNRYKHKYVLVLNEPRCDAERVLVVRKKGRN